MKRLVQRLTATNVTDLTIRRWYDKSTRNWIVTLHDSDDNQVGDSIVVYSRGEASNIKKDNPAFNVPSEPEDRYGFSVPQEFRPAMRALVRTVDTNPGDVQVWDVKTRSLKFRLYYSSATLFITRDSAGARGVCGVLPILRWMKAKLVRLRLGTQELTLRNLKA